MGYRLHPDAALDDEIRRVATETLSDAARLLVDLHLAKPAKLESRVHRVRKRCKETRGLLRLAAPALGRREFRRTDRLIRDAARELAGMRDAHVAVRTVASLRPHADGAEMAALDVLEAELRAIGADPVELGLDRISSAAVLLDAAARRPPQWTLERPLHTVLAGLGDVYADGARALRDLRHADHDDELAHEWRRDVKYLWYQTRLLEPSSPAMLGPLVVVLDDLAEALGDDHDLSVLAAIVASRPPGDVDVGDLIHRRQHELRARAIRLGRSVYAEDRDALVARVHQYWRTSRRHGPERALTASPAVPTSVGAETVVHDDRDAPEPLSPDAVERERRFLIDPAAVAGTHEVAGIAVSGAATIEQGYLALDDTVAVRIRRRSDHSAVLTVKAGSGARRSEVERTLEAFEAEELWPRTEGRRVQKTRLDVPLGADRLATVDVFAGHLEGLVMVEVEFDDDGSLQGFEPPPWFGTEVTDDPRYANARLAVSPGPPEAS